MCQPTSEALERNHPPSPEREGASGDSTHNLSDLSQSRPLLAFEGLSRYPKRETRNQVHVRADVPHAEGHPLEEQLPLDRHALPGYVVPRE